MNRRIDLERFRTLLLNAGLTAEQAEHEVQALIVEERALDSRTCPDCGGKLSRTIDARQAGQTEATDAAWFKYRCECGYMLDRAEEVGGEPCEQ